MLKIKVVETGSLGNFYILDNNGKKLIIELGVNYNTFLREIKDINSIVGVALSHNHFDHLNLNLYNKIKGLDLKIISPKNTSIGKKYKVGEFVIVPLPCKHNVDCYGYLIMVDGEKVLFATDTAILPRVNIKVDHFIVEVNYIESIRESAILSGNDLSHFNSIYQNHHSLESTVEYFEKLNYKPTNIITIHKSNSGLFNGKIVKEELKIFCENINVATNGTEYILQEI